MTGVLPALLFVLWLVAIWGLHRYRVWILYYILAAVGSIYWFILVASKVFNLESLLAQSVAWMVHGTAGLFGVTTRIFDGAPGILLVLVIAQEVGWTMLHIGVESSGLLEMGVLVGLLLFYPGWKWTRRLGLIALGSAAIWLANIVRMLIIVIMLNRLGKEALVLAHTYVGKAVFFFMAVGIFWVIITLNTMNDLRPHHLPSQRT